MWYPRCDPHSSSFYLPKLLLLDLAPRKSGHLNIWLARFQCKNPHWHLKVIILLPTLEECIPTRIRNFMSVIKSYWHYNILLPGYKLPICTEASWDSIQNHSSALKSAWATTSLCGLHPQCQAAYSSSGVMDINQKAERCGAESSYITY